MWADREHAVRRLLRLNRDFRESPSEAALRTLVDALDAFVSRPDLWPGVPARDRGGRRPEAAGCRSSHAAQ